MDDVKKQAMLSAIRTLLGALGGVLVTHGVVNEAVWADVMGVVAALVPVIWGVYDKYNAETKTQARVVEAYNAGSSQLPPPSTDTTKGNS